MTEQEWLKSADLWDMLDAVEGKVSERKKRFFALACCQRILHLLPDERCRTGVEALEEYAKCGCSEDRYYDFVKKAAQPVLEAVRTYSNGVIDDSIEYLHVGPEEPELPPETVACNAALAVRYTLPDPLYYNLFTTAAHAAHAVALDGGLASAGEVEALAQRSLLRCICGPLLVKPIVLNPSWLTPTVVSLATAIYDDRAFDRMPILADALEDAGCDNQDILKHCRSGQEHVRGCWVVDLVLGKS